MKYKAAVECVDALLGRGKWMDRVGYLLHQANVNGVKLPTDDTYWKNDRIIERIPTDLMADTELRTKLSMNREDWRHIRRFLTHFSGDGNIITLLLKYGSGDEECQGIIRDCHIYETADKKKKKRASICRREVAAGDYEAVAHLCEKHDIPMPEHLMCADEQPSPAVRIEQPELPTIPQVLQPQGTPAVNMVTAESLRDIATSLDQIRKLIHGRLVLSLANACCAPYPEDIQTWLNDSLKELDLGGDVLSRIIASRSPIVSTPTFSAVSDPVTEPVGQQQSTGV